MSVDSPVVRRNRSESSKVGVRIGAYPKVSARFRAHALHREAVSLVVGEDVCRAPRGLEGGHGVEGTGYEGLVR